MLTAALALTLSSPIAVASLVRAPTSAAATAAFDRWLHARYGSITGYWTCPGAQLVKGGIGCLAEVHAGLRWHETSATASLHQGRITFVSVSDTAWVRHWWPYSRRFIIRSHVLVPGVMSVNSPAYDWGFLALGVDAQATNSLKLGRTVRVYAYDGNGTGWFTFYRFSCSARNGLITCTNRLGDVMRYRPH